MLDLKHKPARAALLKLVETTDVLVTNVRPQALERLGLGYDSLKAANPKLIFAAAVGFAAGGPYAGKPAYDDLIQGASGLATIMAVPTGGDPAYVPAAIADRVTGLYLSSAVSAALVQRERTGHGAMVEVPMLEVFSSFVLGDHLGGLTFDPPIGGPHYARLVSPFRKPYKTSDGFISCLIYTDKQWENFFRLIGRAEDFFTDARFTTQGGRANNIDEVYAFCTEIMLTRTTAEWYALMEEGDIPVLPLNRVDDVLENPHFKETGFFGVMDHPTEGRLRYSQAPVSFDGHRQPQDRPAPLLGEHSESVLREAGLDEAAIKAALGK